MVFRSRVIRIAAIATLVAALLPTAPASAVSRFAYVNANSRQCLGVINGNMAPGTPVVQSPCNGNLDQDWVYLPIDREMRNLKGEDKCLAVRDRSRDRGAPLVIWDCNNTSDQNWHMTEHGTGYVIWNDASNRIVGVAGSSQWPGAPAVLWDWQAHSDQIWFDGTDLQ